MKVDIPIFYLKEIGRADLIPAYYDRKEQAEAAKDLTTGTVVDITGIADDKLDLIKEWASRDYKSKKLRDSTLWGKINTYLKFKRSGDDALVTDLRYLATAVEKYVKQTSPRRRWLYHRADDGVYSPLLVWNVEFTSGDRGSEAHVEVTFRYIIDPTTIKSGGGDDDDDGDDGTALKSFCVTFYNRDVRVYSSDLEDAPTIDEVATKEADEIVEEEEDEEGEKKPAKAKKRKKECRRISEILHSKRLFAETEAVYLDYEKSVKCFLDLRRQVVKQYLARCRAFAMVKRGWRFDDDEKFSFQACSVGSDETGDGRLVIDSFCPKTDSGIHGWSWSSRRERENVWKVNPAKLVTPIMPYVSAFDLDQHRHIYIFASLLKEKVYQKDLSEKLILLPKDKEFIELLLNATALKLEDIVQGKSGGMMILSTGGAGTGKTLTAEVYAETLGRPLYNVQCSQLGVDPEKLEKRLLEVLRRAERWNAILLLDEADVYIRARGMDIAHNAIVGVFLRVLEYYNGVMFMTSNQKTEEIDDAIVSRATAHLRYENPGETQAVQIWRVLSDQFGVSFTADDLVKLNKMFPMISGRSIKNLLKLTKFMASAGKKKPSVEMVKQVSSYVDHGASQSHLSPREVLEF